ncbi:SDR family NAD(P)-dependent oxidoreductase [Klenkia terrae]|uniref:SDR family NAD(P)-dependent oxidoreductase n=1 Tax=Klenkia terrae TaxID=1052259 RepID=UPI00361778E6
MPLITTSFDATSTAADVVAGHDLSGTRAVVTGGGSGIGVETVRALASAGAEVTIAVRDPEQGPAPPRTSPAPPGAPRCGSPAWTCWTWTRSRPSSPTGTGRWTCWSTTPASWPSPSSP